MLPAEIGILDPATIFSTDVTTAGARFRAAAEAGGIAVETITHPLRGPQGETLETLVCGFGPAEADTVLVLNSGTHGTEAFVGAGLQVGVLQDPDAFLARAPGVRVVMIHLINPYGAAWGRYVNEDNVDLMKNLTYGDVVSATDPLFLAFDDVVNFASLIDPAAYAAMQTRRAAFVAEHGMDRLMQALKMGQSARPDSICFNGVGATWSKRTLDSILARRLAGARRACFLDLHSAVGGWGEAYVMTSEHAPSKARVRAWLGDEAHDTDVPMNPPTFSTLGDGLPGLELVGAMMEIGTVDFGDDFREAMAFEMYYHLHGDRDCAHAQQNRRRFLSFYDPQTEAWRRKAWASGAAMFGLFLDGLQAWSAEPA